VYTPPLVQKEETVFRKIIPAAVFPKLREVLLGEPHAALFHDFEPEDLDIQVVIGNDLGGPAVFGRDIMAEQLVDFKWCTDGAADGFAIPSTENLFI
jgi:hypothetical protein